MSKFMQECKVVQQLWKSAQQAHLRLRHHRIWTEGIKGRLCGHAACLHYLGGRRCDKLFPGQRHHGTHVDAYISPRHSLCQLCLCHLDDRSLLKLRELNVKLHQPARKAATGTLRASTAARCVSPKPTVFHLWPFSALLMTARRPSSVPNLAAKAVRKPPPPRATL